MVVKVKLVAAERSNLGGKHAAAQVIARSPARIPGCRGVPHPEALVTRASGVERPAQAPHFSVVNKPPHIHLYRCLHGMPQEGETAVVVFVADDLGAWLVALLAEAGRKKLTTLILGDEQTRALRPAATEAVQLTAAELGPGDAKQAEELAIMVGQLFRTPVLGARGEQGRCWRRCR
ncbi:MAG TPA: hypothetical protein VGF54_18965 [Streptosporangiaceae bacterium]